MPAIVAVHPKISSIVQDCLVKTNFSPVSIQSHLSSSRNVNELFAILRKVDSTLLILDTVLLPKEHCIDTLRRLRLSQPSLRIILLSPQIVFLEQHRNEFAILQIFDTFAYKANTNGLVHLQDSLPQMILHPADAMDFLQKKIFEPDLKNPISFSKSFISVAGLEERTGTTKTALLFSLFLRDKVLLVELNEKHPVLLEYFLLEEYFDAATGLYYLPNCPNLAILPLERSQNWTQYIENFKYVVLDLGVFSPHVSDSCYQEFQRSSMRILTSLGSPWSIQHLQNLNIPQDTFLWLNFCPEESLKAIQRNIKGKYGTIVASPYQPNWLFVSKEQKKVCRQLFF